MAPSTDAAAFSDTYLDYSRTKTLSKIAAVRLVPRTKSFTQHSASPHPPTQETSWVRPVSTSQSTTPGISNMTQKAKITYSHPGLQPPVFVAGSLGERPWEPIEMRHEQKENGEHHFWQEFDIAQGEYQYKFRLGPGDWWVLDETAAIVDDGAGNRNNLLTVKAPSGTDSVLDTHVMDQATAPVEAPEETAHDSTHASDPVPIQVHTDDMHTTHEQAQKADEPEAMTHSVPETFAVDEDEQEAAVDTHVSEEATAPVQEPEHSTSNLDASAHVPRTEQSFFNQEALRPDISVATSDPAEFEVELDDGEEEEYEPVSSPLFSHESLSPTRTRNDKDDHAIPLFNHEAMSPIDNRSSFSSNLSRRSNSAASHHSSHYDDEDINDPTLEKFPVERDGILAQLSRSGSRVHIGDDSAIEIDPSSPSLSATRSLSAATSPSVSFAKDLSDHLDCINEDEAEELSPEDDAEKLPLEQKSDMSSNNDADLSPNDDVESLSPEDAVSPAVGLGLTPEPTSLPEKKESPPKLSLSPSHEPVNRGPLTPPLTPIDEPQAKSGAIDGNVDDKSHDQSSYLSAPGSPRSRKDNSTDHIATRSTSKSSVTPADDNNAYVKSTSFWTWVSRICSGRIGSIGVALAVGIAATFYAFAGRNSAPKIREVAEV